MKFSQRVTEITPSQTLQMSRMAKELASEGHDVINLTVGEPDFNTPDEVIEAAHQAMKTGKTKYVPADGISELKERIINKMDKDLNIQYNQSEIYIGSGAKQVLYNAFQSILDSGDEVLIPAPFWVSYPEQVKLAGGVPVFIQTSEDSEFKITVDMIKAHITDKTKAIIINSPSNPTGVIYTKEELQALGQFLETTEVIIISDEIYETLIYNGSHHSIAQFSDKLKEQTLIINGVSKSHAMTGFRIGYACGNTQLIKHMTNITSHSTSNASTPSQYAAVKAYELSESYLEENSELFKSRLNAGYELLMEIPFVECVKPNGAFYLFPNFKVCAEKCGFESVEEFTSALLQETYVVTVPGASFGAKDNIRISYATDEETLKEGITRIKNFVSSKL